MKKSSSSIMFYLYRIRVCEKTFVPYESDTFGDTVSSKHEPESYEQIINRASNSSRLSDGFFQIRDAYDCLIAVFYDGVRLPLEYFGY